MLEYILGKEIASYVRPHKKMIFYSILCATLASLFVVIPAYLLQPFIDECMKKGTEPASWKITWISFDSALRWHKKEIILLKDISPNKLLLILGAIATVSVILKSVFSYLSGMAAVVFSNRAVRALRIDLFKKFTYLPLSYYHNKKIGDLIGRATSDIGIMQTSIANILIGLIQHPLTIVVFLIYLLIMDYKMTLLMFMVVPVIVYLVRLFGSKVKKHAKRMQDSMAEVTAAYQELLQCLKVVHGFFRGEHEIQKFTRLADELYRRVIRWRKWHLGLSPIMDITVFLLIPGILVIGRLHFHHSLGELISMLYAYSKIYQPIKKLTKLNNDIKTLHGATERVFGILNTEPAIKEKPDAVPLPRHKEYIEFRNVSFGYNPEKPVLKNISFKVNAGEMVAFVGSTGSGKSTLLELIPRFYDVTSGSIIIDGYDIRDVTLESLRKQIGIVSQDIILFHDTIENNIKYGVPDKRIEDVIEVAKAAHAHDFIIKQPASYKTVIGDKGDRLSGGQKQRIAISRALLINPSILILDEAASALDAESEQFIQKTIDNLIGKCTILVAAHRLNTVVKANRIYVLEEGRIVEQGTWDELMTKGGRFQFLYELQFKNHRDDRRDGACKRAG
ncbi:MAG: ABC transporter ATP-binding protein [Deltaproteobacteria bacterium]|nr:MAG: ABC transporter ATP-binding protein [Deltaproteobacteria bacterium]